MISEIYTGDTEKDNIPIVINEDSKALVESLASTKKVKRKTMRLVISSIQQRIREGIVSTVNHVSSEKQLADIFTKRGAKSDTLLEVLSSGNLSTRSNKR